MVKVEAVVIRERIETVIDAVEEATEAFQESGKISLTEAEGSNVSTLRVSIPMYGFSIPNGFSFDLVPVVTIKCELVDHSGKTIWSAHESVGPLGNPADSKSLDQFYANPKLIEDSWRTAIRSMMADITSHF